MLTKFWQRVLAKNQILSKQINEELNHKPLYKRRVNVTQAYQIIIFVTCNDYILTIRLLRIVL